MATKNASKKSRNFMYTQQAVHLPNNMSPDDLYDRVDKVLKPKRWAGILHDHDMKDDNVTPAEDNVHVMMQFENARSVNQVAKEIGDAPQYLAIWNGEVSNGFAYLIHATQNARHKHQYSCDQVVANFDYTAYINQAMKKALKVEGITSVNKINGMLDLIAIGELSLRDAKKQLSGSAYAKASQKLQRAHELYLEYCADNLHTQMEKNNELVKVHWFYGPSETGKSFLAKKLAKEEGAYYVATATKDAFQYYQGEPIIILDELRPASIPYSELLAMFNPFSRGKVIASSRYFNKALACRTFYVTTPFDPVTFYLNYNLNIHDTGFQLFRRLSSVLFFEQEHIYRMEYDEVSGNYSPADYKANPYSRTYQPKYVLENIFDKL